MMGKLTEYVKHPTDTNTQNSRTLPNRAIVRRATGVPGKMRTPSIYEDTDFTPKVPAKRSVSNVSTPRGPAPNQPPPRLVSSGSPQSSKKRLSATPSSGGSSEHLDIIQEGSNRGSIASVDSLIDEAGKDYEPIDQYLVTNHEGEPPKPSNRWSQGAGSFPVSSVPGQRSSVAAPRYPAPPPPTKLPSDDENDDGYEPVRITEGSVTSAFVDEVDRAALPFRPTPLRSSVSMSEATPTRNQDRDRSPSAPEATPIPSTRISTSPRELSKSPPKFADTKHGKILIPPEPTSPPPSPPTDRDVVSPSSPKPRPPSPLTHSIGTRPLTPEQPKLPPKQRKSSQLTPTWSSQDDNVYEFDRLSPPPIIPNKADQHTSPPSHPEAVEEDNVYFEGPPPKVMSPVLEANEIPGLCAWVWGLVSAYLVFEVMANRIII